MQDLIKDLKEKKCLFFGSYVYKYLLRGEKIRDIDVGVPDKDFEKIKLYLENVHNCVKIEGPTKSGNTTKSSKDSEQTNVYQCYNFLFDLHKKSEVKELLSSTRCNVFKLIQNKNGYAYVDKNKIYYDTPKIENTIKYISTKDAHISCLFKWKHILYFNNWSFHYFSK